MPNKMLIDATHPEETRVVVVRGNRVEEFDFEAASRKQLRGNIYLAKVTRVEPSLQAAFIEYGGNRHGFLAFSEIHPDYYQIPVADRQALIEADERAHREAEEEEAENRSSRRRSRHRSARRRNQGERVQSKILADGAEEIAAHKGEATTAEITSHDEQSGLTETAAPASTPAETAGEGVALSEQAAVGAPSENENQARDQGSDHSSETAEAPAAIASAEAASVATAIVEAPVAEAPITEADATPAATADAAATDEAPAVVADQGGEQQQDDAAEGVTAAAAAEASQAEIATDDNDNDDDHDDDHDDDDHDDDHDDEEEQVESVGGDDILEEVPDRAFRPRRQYKIQEVIKRRQVMLVQVVKEERGNKGAALTTYLSLAGRYAVLMPNTARGGGISRKITSSQDRSRLKEVVQDLDVPEGMGVILRTAGASRTKPEIKRDFEYLLRMWETVRDTTLNSQAPTLVYEEGSLIKRSLRDLYNKDIDDIIVAGDAGYSEARSFMKMLMPSSVRSVKPYHDAQPLFSRMGVESQLDAMFSPTVQLRSGGYIVINQTEALVSIDVNSGRSTREHHIEDTALKTNLEAAEEVARQLRLRDLAGLIVIDFIDMDEKRNNRAVERKIADCLKQDRARIQIGRISHFGLLEMSRQRIRASMLESSTECCPHCAGSGRIRSVGSVALQLLRGVEEILMKGATHNLVVRTRTDVALYVLNHKRGHLHDLETSFKVSVAVTADQSVNAEQAFAIDRGEQVHTLEAAKALLASRAQMSASLVEEADEDDDVADENDLDVLAEDAAASETNGDSEDDKNGDGRKRRRRRRRGRGRGAEARENGDDEQSQQDADADSEAHAETHAESHRGRGRGAEARENGDDEQSQQDADADSEAHAETHAESHAEAASNDDASGETADVAAAGSSEEAQESSSEEQDGERKPRRRGRRGGRRRRDDDESALAAAIADDIAQPEVSEAASAAADLDGAADSEAVPEAAQSAVTQAPEAEAPVAAVPATTADPSAPEAASAESETTKPRRRSTVREKVTFTTTSNADNAAASTPAPQDAAPATPSETPATAPQAATLQPEPSATEGSSQPRRAGWWARRFGGGA